MNLAIRGIDGQVAHGATFHDDRHPDLEAEGAGAYRSKTWTGCEREIARMSAEGAK